MKLVIEQSDVEEVSSMIKGYFRVDLTPEQTTTFIENEEDLAADAYKWGWSDTEVRERLCEAFYKRLCAESWPGEKDGMFDKVKKKAREYGFAVLD